MVIYHLSGPVKISHCTVEFQVCEENENFLHFVRGSVVYIVFLIWTSDDSTHEF